MTKVACIDLFCGAGGLTHGLTSAGIRVVAGIDVDPACHYPFETNNAARFVNCDVSRLTGTQLNDMFGKADIRILAGCAPCQPFSAYSHRYDITGSSRWSLLKQFGRLVRETLPDLVTMENVPLVAKHTVFDDFIRGLERKGYIVYHDVINCASYGLPQNRRRMVLIASRHGDIELIPPPRKGRRTVRAAIGNLPPVGSGETHPSDSLSAASRLSKLNLERIRVSRPGGTWRDWPTHLVAKCHRSKSGHTYPAVYGRMRWDEPAPTLTTQFYGFGNGRFGHPEQDRAITLREGAILQGFPKAYAFVPSEQPVRFTTLGRMIGNAVPVTLGKAIGRSIATHLRSNNVQLQ